MRDLLSHHFVTFHLYQPVLDAEYKHKAAGVSGLVLFVYQSILIAVYDEIEVIPV